MARKSEVLLNTAVVLTSVTLVLFEVLPMNIYFYSSRVSSGGNNGYLGVGFANNNGIIKSKILQKHVIVSTGITTITGNERSGLRDSNINNNDVVGVSRSSSAFSSKSASSSKKIVHTSIRIEEEVFNSLQREAERQGIAVNGLINKTLKNYVTSEMYFEQLGFILVSKSLLRKIFSYELDERNIVEYGKELGAIASKEYASYFFPEVNINTIIQFLDIWFRRFQLYQHRVENISVVSSGVGGYGKEKDDGDTITTINKKNDKGELAIPETQRQQQRQRHLFTLIHDINMNFSILVKGMLEGLVEPIIKSPIYIREITVSSISFSFEITC
jgi:predicted HicB family RNase H-like nuclease